MKRALLKLMWATGAFGPFRLANRHKALILFYHRFSENDHPARTSAHTFAEQLKYLRTHYTVVPLSQIAAALAGGPPLPLRAAAITIDDGYRDAYEIAFPLLRQYDAPATLFVVTKFLDREIWLWTDKLRVLTARTRAKEIEAAIAGDGFRLALQDRASRLDAAARVNSALKQLPDEAKEEAIHRLASSLEVQLPDLPPPEFGPITWDQARELDASGVKIESHTVTHPILTKISDAQLEYELSESRARLNTMLRREVEVFCYPNGSYDARVQREVRRAGYTCAVTARGGLNDMGSNVLALRRIHGERDLEHFVQSTSGFEQLKARFRRAHRESLSQTTD